MTAIQPARPADEYRRRARRLRANLSNRPAELQVALRTLAGSSPSVPPARVVAVRARLTAAETDALPGLSSVELAFDARVAGHLRTTAVVTYTDRATLLKLAERAGVSRFRANLILALRQHAVGAKCLAEPTPSGRPSWALVAAAAVLVEVVTVAVLWSRL